MQELKDLVASDKDIPGQKLLSDTTIPADEPAPVQAFSLRYGTVSCVRANSVVVGANTAFTQEVEAGQHLRIAGNAVVVESVQSDTSLTLTEPWNYESVKATIPYVHIYRPFSEFYDVYSYPLTTTLGGSGFRLRDLMTNFIPPVIEKDTTGIAVPTSPATPTTSLSTLIDDDSGTSRAGTRSLYVEQF